MSKETFESSLDSYVDKCGYELDIRLRVREGAYWAQEHYRKQFNTHREERVDHLIETEVDRLRIKNLKKRVSELEALEIRVKDLIEDSKRRAQDVPAPNKLGGTNEKWRTIFNAMACKLEAALKEGQ